MRSSSENKFVVFPWYIDYDVSEKSITCVETFSDTGFLPIFLGMKINDYLIVRKLGCGLSSTVWLVLHEAKNECWALKVGRSTLCVDEALTKEYVVLKELYRIKNSSQRIEIFYVDKTGLRCQKHGIFHTCLLFPVMGATGLNVFEAGPLSLESVTKVAKNLLEDLVILHENLGVAHTDIKPENIILTLEKNDIADVYNFKRDVKCLLQISQPYIEMLPEEAIKRFEEMRLQYTECDIDTTARRKSIGTPNMLGSFDIANCRAIYKNYRIERQIEFQSKLDNYLKEKHFNKKLKELIETEKFSLLDFGSVVFPDQPDKNANTMQTRQYRSPEVILGLGVTRKSDLWSLACVLFEFYTTEYLFSPAGDNEDQVNADHIALIMELLGPFPQHMLTTLKTQPTFLSSTGEHLLYDLNFCRLDQLLTKKYNAGSFEAWAFASFLLPMLSLDPELRPDAAIMLTHPWLHNQPIKSRRFFLFELRTWVTKVLKNENTRAVYVEQPEGWENQFFSTLVPEEGTFNLESSKPKVSSLDIWEKRIRDQSIK